MTRIKVLIENDFFINHYEDFVLINALNAISYNFREVVGKLKIEQEVEEFFGKNLEKYAGLDQFEKIIDDILAGTKPENYESLLIKMHQNFLFPDHILILNPEHISAADFNKISGILRDQIKINTHYQEETKQVGNRKFKEVTGVIKDFLNKKEGVYCFILLHQSDFTILGQENLKELFRDAVKGIK
jgi:hypothetical protein